MKGPPQNFAEVSLPGPPDQPILQAEIARLRRALEYIAKGGCRVDKALALRALGLEYDEEWIPVKDEDTRL